VRNTFSSCGKCIASTLLVIMLLLIPVFYISRLPDVLPMLTALGSMPGVGGMRGLNSLATNLGGKQGGGGAGGGFGGAEADDLFQKFFRILQRIGFVHQGIDQYTAMITAKRLGIPVHYGDLSQDVSAKILNNFYLFSPFLFIYLDRP
jgi:hypothetical protein